MRQRVARFQADFFEVGEGIFYRRGRRGTQREAAENEIFRSREVANCLSQGQRPWRERQNVLEAPTVRTKSAPWGL